MSEQLSINIALAVSILIIYAVRSRPWRKWLGLVLLLGSPVAMFQFRLLPESFSHVYAFAWVTGLDLFFGRNRYVRED